VRGHELLWKSYAIWLIDILKSAIHHHLTRTSARI
jgi:hypothetical protein